jgi:ABC-2 type transport system permease protein
LNDGIKRVRMRQLGIDPKQFHGLLDNVNIESMDLVSRDETTGAIHPAEKREQAAAFVPVALVMMLLMIVMITSAPMLNAIAEDKMQRVFEMLLASATPFELITGKVLAALGRALTSSLLYIAGAILVLNAMALMGIAPMEVLPWFLIYLVAEITMLCAIASALGAACGSPQDAQSLGMFLFGPIMIPVMMIANVMQRPNGTLATVMSFIPPFTPVIMLVRQSMPGGVPAWQPWVALAALTIGLIAICWVAARIFRIGILLQGKPPNLAELAKWAIRG